MSPSDPPPSETGDGLARSVDSLFEALTGEEEAGGARDPEAAPKAETGTALGTEDAAGADPEAAAAEDAGHALPAVVEAWLEAPGEPGREAALAEEIRSAGELHATEALAAVAAELLRHGGRRGLERVRDFLSPGVASGLAAHLPRLRDEEERRELEEAFTRLGEPMAEALAEQLSDARDRFARRTYIDGLVAMGEDGRSVVLGMLEDPRWFVVRNGVTILGELGGEDVVQHLTGTLAHPDARVRTEAVRTLARIGGGDAGDLAAGMLEDPDPDVRAAAALAVGVLRVERAGRPLLERIESEEDRGALVSQIRALGRLGDPGAVQALERKATGGIFSRQPPEVRAAAFRALADIGTPHARRLLRAGAEDRDTEVREAAASALAALEAKG